MAFQASLALALLVTVFASNERPMAKGNVLSASISRLRQDSMVRHLLQRVMAVTKRCTDRTFRIHCIVQWFRPMVGVRLVCGQYERIVIDAD